MSPLAHIAIEVSRNHHAQSRYAHKFAKIILHKNDIDGLLVKYA